MLLKLRSLWPGVARESGVVPAEYPGCVSRRHNPNRSRLRPAWPPASDAWKLSRSTRCEANPGPARTMRWSGPGAPSALASHKRLQRARPLNFHVSGGENMMAEVSLQGDRDNLPSLLQQESARGVSRFCISPAFTGRTICTLLYLPATVRIFIVDAREFGQVPFRGTVTRPIEGFRRFGPLATWESL